VAVFERSAALQAIRHFCHPERSEGSRFGA
jgi:hypothetical protein